MFHMQSDSTYFPAKRNMHRVSTVLAVHFRQAWSVFGQLVQSSEVCTGLPLRFVVCAVAHSVGCTCRHFISGSCQASHDKLMTPFVCETKNGVETDLYTYVSLGSLRRSEFNTVDYHILLPQQESGGCGDKTIAQKVSALFVAPRDSGKNGYACVAHVKCSSRINGGWFSPEYASYRH